MGVESENAPRRGQFLPDSPLHSGAMGQEAGKKWAAAAHSQPTIPKSDKLLGAARTKTSDESRKFHRHREFAATIRGFAAVAQLDRVLGYEPR
ncbi:MAG: hypothetical protein AB7V41_08735, partial [Burkholderiaceae bacterium]